MREIKKGKYRVFSVPDQVFDNLPVTITRGSDISDSLGFANPKAKVGFVRDTYYEPLNQYLMDHEMEHLIEKHKTDIDENGICHKKGGFFRNFMRYWDPLNVLGTRGGHPFAGIGDAFKGGAKGFVGSGFNPLGGVLGAIGGAGSQQLGKGGRIMSGGGARGGAGDMSYNMAAPGAGAMNSLFGSPSGFQPGFGQPGAHAPAGIGQTPSSSLGLGQVGLGQGGINLGSQMGNMQGPQQSGGFFPQMGQSALRF